MESNTKVCPRRLQILYVSPSLSLFRLSQQAVLPDLLALLELLFNGIGVGVGVINILINAFAVAQKRQCLKGDCWQ